MFCLGSLESRSLPIFPFLCSIKDQCSNKMFSINTMHARKYTIQFTSIWGCFWCQYNVKHLSQIRKGISSNRVTHPFIHLHSCQARNNNCQVLIHSLLKRPQNSHVTCSDTHSCVDLNQPAILKINFIVLFKL